MHEAAQAIRDDDESGAAALSLQALDALHEAAAEADDPALLVELARDLHDARPAMTAIANRVDRAMATADSLDPGAVAAAAERVRADAATADRTAARRAAALLGDRVLTLSRSGTAMEAIQTAAPDRVFVAESRPAREGVDVAEILSDALAVTLHTDAAIATAVADLDIETVAPDGRVLNKTGTRVAALAARHAGILHLVVAARDKVALAGDDLSREHGDPADIYASGGDIDVYAPTFDVTPADLVTVVTEDGPQSPDAIAAIAAEHREHADWDDHRRCRDATEEP